MLSPSFCRIIYVRHYANAKNLGVSVAQPKAHHPMAGEYVCKAAQNKLRLLTFLVPYIGTPPRQLSGNIVAQEVALHWDTPNICVCVISDI